MSIQDTNKKLARRWVESYLSTGDEKVAREICADNYQLFFPGVEKPMKYDEAKNVIPTMRVGFPDLDFHIDSIVCDGDKVVMRMNMQGKHKGEFQGISPTEKNFKLGVLVEFLCRDGKIVEDRPYFDRLSMLEQLGVIPLHAKEPALV
jgi:predicted ester cyclase